MSSLSVKKPDNKVSVIVAGKMFAGKSTFKDVFIQEAAKKGIDFKVQPLALELKVLIAKYYGLTLEELEQVKPVIRGDLQRVGTELLRNQYHDNFWTILALRNPAKYLVFDDCRFQSEVHTIEEYSTTAVFVQVEASIEARKLRCEARYGSGFWEKQDQYHTSETSQPGPRLTSTGVVTIMNNGTEERFKDHCVHASNVILSRLG